jgi:16S rRNA (cytidine1402-2'-O)-methyltransferase
MKLGLLYIVATPIGNREDLTFRALETLKQADLIACEDTRTTQKLLAYYKLKKPLISFHQHSKLEKVKEIISKLESGKSVALVTDAGTPGVSDPGGKLIEVVIARGVGVVPIPGTSAAITALSVSGFPADKFVFLGFPPHKKGRDKYFKEITDFNRTVVFYESTHRILKTLETLKNLLPHKKIMVGRELTKMFETIYRGTPEEILQIFRQDKNNLKGEFVIVIRE